MPAGPQRFGLFLAPFHALDEDPTLAIDRDLELVQLADRLGFQEVWVGEHHSGGFEIIASPEVFIAAAAEKTKYIRLGTGVKSVPYHNPRMVADTMVQLDHMTRGRTMFGVGPGALPFDAIQIGLDPAATRRQMDEALEVIIPLLKGEIVSKKTDWFNLQNARLQLPSFTKPHMEMAVTTIRSPAGVQAAGRHGLGVLVLGGTNDESLVIHKQNWGIHAETAREHGNKPNRDKWRITVNFHLADSFDDAKRDLDYGFQKWVGYAQQVLPATPVPLDVDHPLEWALDNQFIVLGTPEDAIREIERIYRGVGGFGTLLCFAHNWAPWAQTQRSYELFARYVVPHFTRSRELRQWAYDWSAENHDEFSSRFRQATAASQAAYEKRKVAKGKAKKAKRKKPAKKPLPRAAG